MLRTAGVPYWRLSGFYFCYFALLGAWMPFWNVHLADRGVDADTLGLISAITMGTKVLAPTIWSWIAQRTRAHTRLIQLGSSLTLASALLFIFQPTDAFLVAAVLVYSFFWNAVLPLFEVVTVEHLGSHSDHYSKIRLWGSVGFIVTVLILGAVFDFVSIHYLPWVLLVIITLMSLSSVSISMPASLLQTVNQRALLTEVLKRPWVWVFMTAVMLQQVAHGPYYTFYSIHLSDLGYSNSRIGLLWSLGVLAEIALFAVMHRLLPYVSIKWLFVGALLLSILRWWLIAYYASSVLWAVIAQLLHAASFGVCHAVAIEFVREQFAGIQSVGQALYSGISFGLGGAIGALWAGQLWHLGAGITFMLAVAASAIAMVLLVCCYRTQVMN